MRTPMNNIESKSMLLQSVVSGELEQLGKKMEFWLNTIPVSGTVWQNEDSISVRDVLATIGLDDDCLAKNPELSLLYGIAWEFVWGEESPEMVARLRDVVITKARTGMDLNDLEGLWYSIICVDTDMF